MYLRRITVHNGESGEHPCPLKWLDNFAMRNFTNDPVFDATLPIADGLMEIGNGVPIERLREAMEDWFKRKGYLAKEDRLSVNEQPRSEVTKQAI